MLLNSKIPKQVIKRKDYLLRVICWCSFLDGYLNSQYLQVFFFLLYCLVSSVKNYPVSCLRCVCWGMGNKLGCWILRAEQGKEDGRSHHTLCMISPCFPQLWLASLSLELVCVQAFSKLATWRETGSYLIVAAKGGDSGQGVQLLHRQTFNQCGSGLDSASPRPSQALLVSRLGNMHFAVTAHGGAFIRASVLRVWSRGLKSPKNFYNNTKMRFALFTDILP